MEKDYWHETTSVSMIQYHFVWIVRRRRKILTGDLDKRVIELIKNAVKEIDGKVIALETGLDHVYLFMQAKPAFSPAQIMYKVKGSVSHQIRIEFPWVKDKLPSLWTRSYFVGTTGKISGDTVKKYVDGQKSQ
jgi:putative transposase